MTTTTSTFLSITQNLANYQKATASEPAVKTATAYYEANIGSVTSAKDLVSNYRLLSYALDAYGLGDQINSTALITKVIEGGTTDPKALANTLTDPRWKAFAAAFNFSGSNTSTVSSSASVTTTVNNYVEQQLEIDQGQQDPGVQLALYFQRVAPTVTDSYGILGDKNLLEVVQTIFGLSQTASATEIDAEAASVSKLVPLSDLQDPKKLLQLTERFTAMYDLDYGGASGSSSSLTVNSGTGSSPVSAASSILAGIVSSNGSALSSTLNTSPFFSSSLMMSIQGVRLGG